MKRIFSFGWSAFVLLAGPLAAPAWDYEGHRMVNQLALASLPADFPAFAKTPAAKERVAFLSGEPDRWRNTPDLPLKHFNGPDHYLDLDDLDLFGLKAQTLPEFRHDFTAQLALARAAHPTNFPALDPARNTDHTRELVGFLPWAITEQYGKLKSGFSYLKTFQQLGTPEEVANAQQNILYIMGTMGHYVGDGSQPLHMTKHHHGWVGENPHRYATNHGFHQWIDGGYIYKLGLKTEDMLARLRPARTLPLTETKASPTNVFPIVMRYLGDTYNQVEPLYKLDKERKFSSKSDIIPEGRAYIEGRLLVAGQMLGDLWLTAWQHAPEDTFLRTQLLKRKNAGKIPDEAKP